MSLSALPTTSNQELPSPGQSQIPENSALVLAHPIVWTYGVLALTFPFWPIYFTEIGLSERQIALLLAVGPVAAIFSSQVWGYLADVVYNIRFTLILMAVCTALVSVVIPLYRGFWPLMGIMALFAVFFNARFAMCNAMVLDSRCGEKRFGPLRTVGSASFIVVGFIASALTDIDGMGGTRLIFPALIVVNLLSAAAMFPVKDYPFGARAKMHAGKKVGFVEVQRYILGNRVIRAYFLFLIFASVPHHLSHQLVAVLVNKMGHNNLAATLPVYIGAVAEIFVFLSFTRITSSVRLMPLFFISAAGQLVRWTMIYLWPTLPVIYAASVLHMLSYGLMFMCSVILFNRELPVSYRSSGQNLLNMMYTGVGMTFGPLIGAFFFRWHESRFPDAEPWAAVHQWFGLAAIFSAVALPTWVLMKRRYNAEHGVRGFWVR